MGMQKMWVAGALLAATLKALAAGPVVGVSWSNFQEERWKTDEAAIKAELARLGASYVSADAGGSPEKQIGDVESLLAKGAKVLIILAMDKDAILPALNKAKARKVPVVAYDRLIEAPEVFYLTFDNREVGRLQAKAVLAIKPISAGGWKPGEKKTRNGWWYRPLEDQSEINLAVRFSLSLDPVVSVLPTSFTDLAERSIIAGRSFTPATERDFAAMEAMGFRVTHLYGLTESYGPATICAWQPEWDSLALPDRAVRMALDGYAKVPATGRHRIEHIETIDPADMPRFAALATRLMLRGGSYDVHAALAIAQAQAVRRGELVAFVGDGPRGRIRVVAGTDTLFARDLGARGLTLALTRDSITWSPNGQGWGAANTTIIVSRRGLADTITVSRLGRVR